jgi:hypothetical protein
VQFWEHNLPFQMTELAAQLEPGHRFDSIVVDEAQDFADAWWIRCRPSRTTKRVPSMSSPMRGAETDWGNAASRAVSNVVSEETAFSPQQSLSSAQPECNPRPDPEWR